MFQGLSCRAWGLGPGKLTWVSGMNVTTVVARSSPLTNAPTAYLPGEFRGLRVQGVASCLSGGLRGSAFGREQRMLIRGGAWEYRGWI